MPGSSARRRADAAGCLLFNSRTTDHGKGRRPYDGLADAFGVYAPWEAQVYLVPVREVTTYVLSLRTEPLLYGIPGTAKSWVSEHLAAAISGDSTMLVQGTAGTGERRSATAGTTPGCWPRGRRCAALVPSPIMRAMATGKIARVEELTRIPADVQDTLITILSEKTLPIPELGTEVQARKGFNVIATANNRDKGVNELSSALRRRFNTVVLPVPDDVDEEVEIVSARVAALGRALELPAEAPALEEIRRVVTIFRELRDGHTADGKTKLKSPERHARAPPRRSR